MHLDSYRFFTGLGAFLGKSIQFEKRMTDMITPKLGAPPQQLQRDDAGLKKAANKLETLFLAEMLKSAGMGKSRDALGGGAGEDQFGSFLREAQAAEMVRAGGIGLAEALFQSLKEQGQ